jgi:hypothetical protein
MKVGLLGSSGIRVFIENNKFGIWIKRTWKERLFSLPWKPWVRQKFSQDAGSYVLPDGKIIRSRDSIYVNPNTMKMINQAIESREYKHGGKEF